MGSSIYISFKTGELPSFSVEMCITSPLGSFVTPQDFVPDLTDHIDASEKSILSSPSLP